MKIYSTILIILIATAVATAQEKFYRITYLNSDLELYTTEEGRSDSSNFVLKVRQVQQNLFGEGYLLTNVDNIDFTDSLFAEINIGEQYFWNSLGIINIPEEMLSKSGYRTSDFSNKKFSISGFRKLITKLLSYSANNGYPFAEFQLQEIQTNQQYVAGKLFYKPGPVIQYDSLTLNPGNLVKHEFLESYLNLRKGQRFDLRYVQNIPIGFDQLPYCQLVDSIRIGYENNLCNIFLSLKPVKSNRIDALIGFLPNQNENNGLRITGFVNLKLENLFRSGKSLSLIWQQFQNESQKLDFDYRHPNLFNSRIGVKFNLNLIKQDTSFLNTDLGVDAFYQKDKLEISFTSNFKSSRTLSTPGDSLVIPTVMDFNLQQFGFKVTGNGIGQIANPFRGGKVFGAAKIGSKQIQKTAGLSEEVYDSLNLNPVQFEASIGGEINQRIVGNFVLHTDVVGSTILNNDVLFTNDMLRLGGVNSLRGFNDLELLVSSYALARVEARLLIDDQSRLFVFFDQALTNNISTEISDAPFGFGAGLFLRTGSGDLQLVYALGVSQQQSLSLNQSKIHIGYVARF